MRLTGQVAVVTGAGSGIGRAVSLALAKAGIRVALVGRQEEKLRETESALRESEGTCRIYAADASSPEAMEAVWDDLRARWGEPLILVNNAGVHGEFAPLRRSNPVRWRETLLTNLYAPYLLCRICAPAMVERGWGRIVNVSSAAGLSEPHGMNSAYNLSKYALNYFTRQMAEELGDSGASCTAIHPGEVKSEMWAAITHDAESRGPEAQGARNWSGLVEETGGDAPEKAADLVLRILHAEAAEVNGRFMWIEGGLQPPRPTW
ncbi:MAG: SDR family oxidoreductase [Armatimonadetes bacterium]|nr:SDR family oxidoreductase [Armatimonadota bacterium]